MSGLGWLAAGALGRAETASPRKAKSLILLWMAGGPSQLETFDPHPGRRCSGPTRAIATSAPGVQFAQHLPRLAELADLLAVVRSVVSKEGDHERGQYTVRTGYRPDPAVQHPTLGAIAARQLPGAGVDLPPYISILSGDSYADGGYLGGAYQAYRVGDPMHPPRNLTPRVGEKRMAARLDALDVLEARHRGRSSPPAAAERTREQVDQAVRMLHSEQRGAFHLDEEPLSVRAAYGETPFGRGCLAARRLIETGVRAVEVQLPGWDSHTRNFETQPRLAAVLDAAFSALVLDLRRRGLLETTLIVCGGEFGRTPKINVLDGRDHWPTGFSVVLAGGGVPGGTIVGGTDPEGSADPVDPVSVSDLTATVLRVLGIDPALEFTTGAGRPIKLSEGVAVSRLLPL
jgi:hypothetical protein